MGKQHFNLFYILFLIFSSYYIAQSHGKTHGEKLSHLYKAKLNKVDSGIDTDDFRPIHFVNRPEIHPQGGLKERDRIGKLPGQPQVDFEQYGGYVTVDQSAGRAFYYYFVEAQKSKNSAPLLLWLNGGPGCSSLAYGAMQELGPFRVHSDGKTLFRNRYSWNNAANVLFLESPAGVGFSYSNTTSDSQVGGDRRTASDNYVFLVNWLERFLEYKGRDFYISGESYAGHYVPQLADTILRHNSKANKTIINLKGIIIGNAAIDDHADGLGMYDYLATHAVISDEVADRMKKYCDISLASTSKSDSEECAKAEDEYNADTSYIDIYNIYAPLCHSPNLTAYPKKNSLLNFDPCSDNYVHAYLNRAEVQKAMHANVTKLDHAWISCSDILTNWNDSPASVLPLFKDLLNKGIRVWIFSGDTDGRVPVTSTKYSLKKLNLPVKTSWHPWYLFGEVGGYTQVYKGDLTFATIRGAGHQVPSFEPKRALSLISHFLNGSPLPDTTRY